MVHDRMWVLLSARCRIAGIEMLALQDADRCEAVQGDLPVLLTGDGTLEGNCRGQMRERKIFSWGSSSRLWSWPAV